MDSDKDTSVAPTHEELVACIDTLKGVYAQFGWITEAEGGDLNRTIHVIDSLIEYGMSQRQPGDTSERKYGPR